MITLGEFTGLLMSDFLQARKMADACAASISEEYHVNPLLKGMPVPRYTISEAEIDVPVQIAGVQQVKVGEEEMKKLLMKIEKVLPTLLYRNIKNCYYEKQEERVFRQNGTIEPEEVGVKITADSGEKEKAVVIKLSELPDLKESYKRSAASICTLMNQYMDTYIKENVISDMKLLDFTDVFTETLKSVMKQEFGIYPDEQTPFINKNSLKKMCRIIGSTMFFEFKEIFEQQEGVLIIPETGKMEQNCTPEQVMRMKIKIREQDVDFIVNRDDETGETDRFLALS